jgi:toxin ParE1/3/4
VKRLQFHPAARIELDAARRYYRAKDPAVAKRFSSEILLLLERITHHPTQFPEHGLLAVPTRLQTLFFPVRKAVLPRAFPYVLFYYVRDRTAVVLAVAHAKRRPGYWAHRA